MTQRSASYNWL